MNGLQPGASWAELLWVGFLDISLRAAAILAIALCLSVALRRVAANARYVLWSTALVSVLAMPALKLALPAWEVAMPEALLRWLPEPSAATSATIAPKIAPRVVDSTVPEFLQDLPPERPTEPWSAKLVSESDAMSWRMIALSLWATGATLVFLWLLLGLVRAHRFAARATPLAGDRWHDLLLRASQLAGLSRQPALLSSREIDSPVTWGLKKPVILLPDGAEEWSNDCLRVVLVHELVHLRRGDWILQLLAQVACVAYWFNPMAWIAVRLHATERERSCDDEVLSLGTRPTTYASHLLDVSQFIKSRAAPPLVALRIVRRRGQLEGRVMRILSPPKRGGRCIWLTAAMALIVLTLASIELGHEPAAGESSRGTTFVADDDSFGFHIEGGLTPEDRNEPFSLRLRGLGGVDIEGDTVSLAPYATLLVETEDGSTSQWLRMTADSTGEPSYVWRVDGEERSFDEVGRLWLQETLRLASHQREISSIRGQRSSLRGKISSIRGQRSSLRGQISSLRGQESSLRGKISSVRGQKNSLRGKINSIRGQENSMHGRVNSLRGQINSLRAQKRRASNETNALVDEQIAALESEIQKVQIEIKAFDAEGRIGEVQAKIDAPAIERQIQDLHLEIENFDTEGRIREVEQQIDALNVEGRIEELQREIEALDVDRRVDDIRSQKVEPSYRALKSLMNDLHIC